MRGSRWAIATGAIAALSFIATPSASADGDLRKVQHIVIVMQENHSFDNYFGALAYAPGSPYHGGPCRGNEIASEAIRAPSCSLGFFDWPGGRVF